MNARKLALAAQALNGIALKVYNAIPIAEAWSLSQIAAELARTGSKPGMPIVEGSARKCVELGLVKINIHEGERFQRIDTTEPTNVLADAMTRAIAAAPPGNVVALAMQAGTARDVPSDILGTYASLAHRARYLSRELSVLADDCDAAAIAAEDQLQKNSESADRLQQLKALLGNL